MLPALASLIALQAVDTAIDHARRRLGELPAAERALDDGIAAAAAAVATAKAKLHETAAARRQFEKDVAAVNTRLARFDDHKAAVKTNEQYTALLHEIATAKAEKDAIEERILIAMEEADGVAAEVAAADQALLDTTRDATTLRAALSAEREALEADLVRLSADRAAAAAGPDARSLALYEQLLKGRRGIAIAGMLDGHCTACHVRLRPHIVQQVRRNDSVVQCDSCQRVLYFAEVAQPPGQPGLAEPS